MERWREKERKRLCESVREGQKGAEKKSKRQRGEARASAG
jgi:hypothetical protein